MARKTIVDWYKGMYGNYALPSAPGIGVTGTPTKPQPITTPAPQKTPAATPVAPKKPSHWAYPPSTGQPSQPISPPRLGETVGAFREANIQFTKDGRYWRYSIPGAGWYSEWAPIEELPVAGVPAAPSKAAAPGGYGGPGTSNVYYDRNYAALRDRTTGEFLSTLNRYGQPAGTPAPYQPRSRRQGTPKISTRPLSLEEIENEIASLEKSLANYEVKGRESQKKQLNYTRARSLARLKRMQSRLDKMRTVYEQMGGGSHEGLSSAAVSSMVKWNP